MLDSQYLPLRTFPKLSDLDQIVRDGGVLLIGGRSGVGKSTFSHRLLHDLAASSREIVDIDLMMRSVANGAGAIVNGADDRDRRKWLREVTRKLLGSGNLSGDQVREINKDDPETEWWERHRQLGEDLGGGSRLIVRLPPADPSIKRINAVIEDLCHYADAAEYVNNSLYLYEYGYPYESQWRLIKDEIETRGLPGIHPFEIPGLTAEDGWAFHEHRITISDAKSSYNIPKDDYIRIWKESVRAQKRARKGSAIAVNLKYLNELGDTATNYAEDDGRSAVGIEHLEKAWLGNGRP
jgi:energy-coupling factor transporter ATP-binding protein EcfA2